jgi:hypothetical protein
MTAKSDAGPTLRFTERDGARVICIVCREADGIHGPTCPLVALDGHVRELAASVGEFVANVKETLEHIGRVIRDERPQP